MKHSRRSPSYTIRNPHGYCFRMIVPRDLQRFVGKTELRYSLSTGYVGLAKSKARLLAGQVQEFFRRLREIIKLGELTDEQIVDLVNRYFRNFLDGLEKIRVEPGAFSKGDVFGRVNQINQSVCRGAITALTKNDYSYVWPFVTDVLEREGLEIDKLTITHNKICREMLKGIIQFGEIEDKRQQGDYSDNLESVFPLPSDIRAEQPVLSTDIKTSESVQKVFNSYWNENLSNWKPRTETQYKTCHMHLLQFLGDNRPVHTVDYDDGRKYKEKLLGTTTNRGTRMSAARVDLYLGYASQVFKWAKRNYRKDIEINPFEGLQLGKKARKRPDTQRDAFSMADLKKLFVDSRYFGQDKWDKANKPHFFWIPLLGLYTGAREEELGQLYVDDIQQIEKVWLLNINENRPDQSVKTDEQRLVPLHDFIVKDLKFIDYVQSLPQEGRVFPQLNRTEHRYTHGFSQWFGKYKKRCGITEDNKSFHSFRHTLTTHLLEKDVEDYRIAWLVGHAIENQTTGRYGKKFYPEIFKGKVVDVIEYDIDLSHLKKSKFVPR